MTPKHIASHLEATMSPPMMTACTRRHLKPDRSTPSSKGAVSSPPLLHSLRLCSLVTRLSGSKCRSCAKRRKKAVVDHVRKHASSLLTGGVLAADGSLKKCSPLYTPDTVTSLPRYAPLPRRQPRPEPLTVTDEHHRTLLQRRTSGSHYAQRELPTRPGTGSRQRKLSQGSQYQSKKSIRERKVRSIIGTCCVIIIEL